MNTKVVDIKIRSLFKPTMIIQMILLLILIIVGIIFIFNKEFDNIFYGVMSVNLLVLAYNNYKYYHKKYMNYLYIIFAIYLIISIIIDIW